MPNNIVEMRIGSYKSLEAGCKASLPVLPKAINEHPDTKTFSIRWERNAKGLETRYEVEDRELWYGLPPKGRGDVGTYIHGWHKVTKQDIHAVARKKGTLEDLRNYASSAV